MQLYRPQQTEVAAACALLRTHFPDAAGDIERGAGILPQLQYSTAADAEQRQAKQTGDYHNGTQAHDDRDRRGF